MKMTQKDCSTIGPTISAALFRLEKDFGIKVLEFYHVMRPKAINFFGRLILFEHANKTGIAYCVSHRLRGVLWNVGVAKYTDSLIAKIVMKKFMNSIKEYTDKSPSRVESKPLNEVHYFDEDWTKVICKATSKRGEKVFDYAVERGAWQKIKNEVGGIY